MISLSFLTRSVRFAVVLGYLLLVGVPFDSSQALILVGKTIQVYGLGPTEFVSIAIDGGVVPIRPPSDVHVVRHADSVTLDFTGGKSYATLQSSLASEADLVDKTGNPVAQKDWESVVWREIDGSAADRKVRDFQPNILAVNGWKFSGISVDFTIGSIKSSYLLLIWRGHDGDSITVKLFTPQAQFEPQRKLLYQLLGGSMLIKN